MDVREKEVVYRQTHIPRDPYSIRVNHVDKAKQIIDDTIKELDDLLGGIIMRENWIRKDSMDLVYPKGATIKDMEQALSSDNKKE